VLVSGVTRHSAASTMSRGVEEGERRIFRFKVGSFDCVAINDGTFFYTADQYFNNADPDLLTAALAEHRLQRDRIPSPYTCLLVDTGEHVVVVDTGADRAAMQDFLPTGVEADVGRFAEGVDQAGVEVMDVERVIVTHAHPDHIGGNTDAAGAPRFPRARLTIWREEWDYWTSEVTLAAQPPAFADPVRDHLLPLADRVELLDEEREIVPGIRAVHAPGHTPGHMALVIHSDDAELLYISDAALHPLHLQHPDWCTVWEMDPDRALHSRRVLFDRAASTGALVLAFHFDPFPSLGRVQKARSGWMWHRVQKTP
jgi:glyoxylase-like metal-dependent hydrolase (beta-lactamase superfamily II)